ncbi:MAG: hypothetical protein DIU79_16700 [Actinobacteria bacterium]|nr:MAG: hypothetical protein DIU79_16700 [Actinomycetota bacterium]
MADQEVEVVRRYAALVGCGLTPEAALRAARDRSELHRIYTVLARLGSEIGSADPHPPDGHVHSDRCRPYEAYTGPILQGRRGETVTRGRADG